MEALAFTEGILNLLVNQDLRSPSEGIQVDFLSPLICNIFNIIWVSSRETLYLIKAKRPVCGIEANSGDPDQTPQNAASDPSLHCLLATCFIDVGIKLKNTTQEPLKRKWTCPIDKSGKFPDTITLDFHDY